MLNITARLHRAFGSIAASFEAEMVRGAPVVTGNLANTITAEARCHGHSATIVITMADYGVFIDQGTGIFGKHKRPIVPRTAKALLTPYGPRKSIKGMEARPWIDKSLNQVIRSGEIEDEIARAFDIGNTI
ncbi:MAG: hypothetical protein K8R90_05245 [Candidatus Cloacimonetes bacterium]|nr:hypothetical protein [Candidatus Cloacimonadota bacterium]